jgi:hypothetical protein
MNRKVNAILGLGVALMSAIAIFVLFSYAFNDSQDLNYNGQSVFTAMFSSVTYNKPAVPGLIVAFSLEIAAFVFAIVAGILSGKASSLTYALTFVFLLVAGILFLNAWNLYCASIPYSGKDSVTIGSGTICSVVFAFIGAVLSLYGAYSNFKS